METFNPHTETIEKENRNFSEAIMTAEEYAHTKHERPYEYELAAADKRLRYFGPGHTYSPTSSVFEKIRQDIDTFKPDIVVIEGNEAINKADQLALAEKTKDMSENDIISRLGESGFTTKLAIEKGIRVISPEPTDRDSIKYLEDEGMSRDHIFAQQMANLMRQYFLQQGEKDLDRYMEHYFESMDRDFDWKDFDFSLEHFKRIHKDVLGREFDEADLDFYKKASDPIPWDGEAYGITNRIAALWNKYRDEYMIREIQQELKQNSRMYIVFGASHAVMQEPALRELFRNLERS